MTRMPAFRRRKRLFLTAAVLVAHALSILVLYATVSISFDGQSPVDAFAVGANPGWALLPQTTFAVILAVVLFGVLGLARRPEKREPFAVVAVLATVGGLHCIVIGVDVFLGLSGTTRDVAPAGAVLHLLTETIVGVVATAVAALVAYAFVPYCLPDGRRYERLSDAR